MVLADAEAIDACLLGDHRLLDDIAQLARLGVQVALGVAGDVAKGIDAQFKGETVVAHISTLSEGGNR